MVKEENIESLLNMFINGSYQDQLFAYGVCKEDINVAKQVYECLSSLKNGIFVDFKAWWTMMENYYEKK